MSRKNTFARIAAISFTALSLGGCASISTPNDFADPTVDDVIESPNGPIPRCGVNWLHLPNGMLSCHTPFRIENPDRPEWHKRRHGRRPPVF